MISLMAQPIDKWIAVRKKKVPNETVILNITRNGFCIPTKLNMGKLAVPKQIADAMDNNRIVFVVFFMFVTCYILFCIFIFYEVANLKININYQTRNFKHLSLFQRTFFCWLHAPCGVFCDFTSDLFLEFGSACSAGRF